MNQLTLTQQAAYHKPLFKVAGVPGGVYLFQGSTHPEYKDGPAHPDDNKVFGLQTAACIKAHYTARDIAEQNALNSMKPLQNGEIVDIDGIQYQLKINGNYSNCAEFIPVQ